MKKATKRSKLGRWALPCVFGGLLVVAAAPPAEAHFTLVMPPSSSAETDGKGAAPCGGAENSVITAAQGGHALHVQAMETVNHRGHYRIALSVSSRSELPADPIVMDKNKNVLDPAKKPTANSDTAAIQSPPVFPVLADNLWDHTTASSKPFETDITLPNVTCDKCTLQVIEFMADHLPNVPGGYFYHHCANLKITADPAMPPFMASGNDGGATDAGNDAGAQDGGIAATGGVKGTGGGSGSGGTGGTTSPGTGGAATGGAATGGAGTGGVATTSTGGQATGGTSGGNSGGGCAIAGGDAGVGAAALALLGLVLRTVRPRRRRSSV